MNLKKTLKYGIITSICLSILFAYIFHVTEKKSFDKSLILLVEFFIGFLIFFFLNAGFLFLLKKVIFISLDNVQSEVQEKNKQKEIDLDKVGIKPLINKKSFWWLLSLIIAIPGVILVLYLLQQYLFKSLLDYSQFLNQTHLSSFLNSFCLHGSCHRYDPNTDLLSNFQLLIIILSMIEFRVFFYKWIKKIWG